MDTIIYSTHKIEKEFLIRANAGKHELKFLELSLNIETAHLPTGARAVEEAGLYLEDHSEEILQDDIISRLLTFRNVGITSHCAFLTQSNHFDCYEKSIDCKNELIY